MSAKNLKPAIFSLTDDPEWIEVLQEYFEETAACYFNFKNEKNFQDAKPEDYGIGFAETRLIHNSSLFLKKHLIKLGSGEVSGVSFGSRLDKQMSVRDFNKTILKGFPESHEPFSILMVEDDKDFCEEIKNYWESQNDPRTRVETVSNGLEALERLKSFVPDVLITDLKMPVLGGVEFYRRFRQVNSTTPLIVLTAITESAEMSALKTIGNPVCVEKSSGESLPDSLGGRALKLKVFGSRDLR